MPETQDAETAELAPPEASSVGYPRDEFDVDVVPGQRRGAHRSAPPAILAALPWVLVGLFVVACIVALITVVTPQPDVAASPTVTAQPTASAAATTATEDPAADVDMGVRLLVLNGTRRTANLTAAKTKLTKAGWIVADTGRNDDRDVATTTVIYKSDSLKPTADALAAFLGNGAVALDPNLPEDMRVVIGENFEADN